LVCPLNPPGARFPRAGRSFSAVRFPLSGRKRQGGGLFCYFI
jgi:hypothetical protein